MNGFFEQELRKLFEDGSVIESPCFPGDICLGTLDRDLRVQAAFASTHTADEYDALRVTVLNRTEGVVDQITLNLVDILGKKVIPGNPDLHCQERNISGGEEKKG